MLTLDEVQERTKKAGAPIADSTFWKYVRLGLLPSGETVPGTGHKRFFPDDLPDRIVQLNWLNKDVGIPLPVLRKSLLYLREGEHWDSTVMRQQPSPLDLIVSWAGIMANMNLVQKPRLDREDLTALFARLRVMFEKLGVHEPSPLNREDQTALFAGLKRMFERLGAHEPSLPNREELAALFARVKVMFEELGTHEPSPSPEAQEHSPRTQETK